MMISWLENGIKNALKIQIKQQMKFLSESARTTQAVLEIAKDEQELLDENVPEHETTAPYVPYFANTVSTKKGITNDASSTLRTPIYINVQINNKQHQAIVDTGSAVTIINQQLLKKIYHTGFVYKKKLHKSANCTSINIIGEIQLEIKIQGYKTLITADVATNLITDLLLGNDWIMQNNVMIDSLQQHITLIDQNRRELATAPFVQPSNLQFSSTNRQRTLSKNTQLGHMSYQAELNNHIILPVLSEDANYQPTHFKSLIYKRNNTRKSGFCDSLLREKSKVQFTDFTCGKEHHEEQQHQCDGQLRHVQLQLRTTPLRFFKSPLQLQLHTTPLRFFKIPTPTPFQLRFNSVSTPILQS
ncbi:unnamed protein product [Rotaria socialis]|uniref:Peptidase A2 domain-containing protein n=1 Tax=Rotaria socialis TaxID=392032 RepID=A0A820YQZ8_9BILA|nr:unnamed protein product [Rotaria socialis]CAF4550103.1 unnamed protein product [Rotaria socialis]